MSDATSPWGQHAGLNAFGDDYQPKHAFRPGIETMSAGDYDIQIVSCQLENRAGNAIAVAVFRLLNAGGREIEYLWWLNKQNAVNGFGADMSALGFPSQTWGNGPGKTPLQVAIPDVVNKLAGVRFRATKATRKVEARPAFGGKPEQKEATYHDLHIGGRITGAPMPTLAPAPAPTVTTVLPSAGQAMPAEDLSKIPF